MKPIYVKTVFDRKKRAGARREGSVDIRLSQDRRTLYYATGIRLLPKHWHDGQVVNRVDAKELQQTLDLMVKHVRQIINEKMEEGTCSLDDVMSAIRAKEEGKLSFLDFCQQRAEVRSYGKSADSKQRYERFIAWLLNFGRIVNFADVTDANILAMDAELVATGMKNYSKWQNYHRFLNSFILDAIDAGHLTRNPYRWLNIVKDKDSVALDKFLSKEELDRIATCDLPTDCLRKVRDLFLFQTYTCLSYVDMKAFDAAAIYYVKGMPVYTSKRGKTAQEFTFMILPQAMEILEKYGGHLPIISNVKYNQYLKVLALMAKVDKPISTHWARPTGATLLLNEGNVDMEVVSKILGHSSTKITRKVYAKLLDETVVKAMSKAKTKLRPPSRAGEEH